MYWIVDELVKFKWILDQIFWPKLLEKKIYKEELEKDKQILKSMWYKNVDYCFPAEVDNKKLDWLLRKVFRFNDLNNLENQKKHDS